MADTKAKELAKISDEETLAGITSLDDAFKALASAGINVTEAKELGTGFQILKEKDQLVGVPFLVLMMQFNSSDKFDKDGEFVSLHVITEKGDKWIVNDGSTGIMAQCQRYAKAGHSAGLIFREGLTRSDYTKTVTVDGKEKEISATTYYLSSV